MFSFQNKALRFSSSLSSSRPKARHVDPADFEVNGSSVERGKSRPQVSIYVHLSIYEIIYMYII